MAIIKYLVTVDAETSTVTKLERMDEDGTLKPIEISNLRLDLVYPGGPSVSPTAGLKTTDGEEIRISFPGKPPGRAR
jgi:hypothetical protein